MKTPKFKIRLSPRLVLLVIVLAITASSIALFSYFLVQNHRRARRFQEGLKQLEAGNIPFAKRLLSISINEDPNNEMAFVKMAELMVNEGRWNNAAIFWHRAAILNPLKHEYRQAEIDALLRGRLFNALLSILELDAKDQKLASEQSIFLAYANYKLDRVLLAEEIFLAITDRDILLTPMARLLETVLNIKKDTTSARMAQLSELAESTDTVVAFEAIDLLAKQFTMDNQLPRAEKLLQRAREINPECGTPLLSQFYFFTSNFDAAIPIFQDIMAEGMNPTTAVMLGEALAAQNRIEEIQQLSKKFRVGNKTMLQVGYYLDALVAFGKKDFDELARHIKRLGGIQKSPVAQMITLHAAVYERSINDITRVVDELRLSSTWRELRDQAMAIVLPLLRQLYEEKNVIAAATLADLFRNPNQPDLFITRVSLVGNFEKKLLQRQDIQAALKSFPDDEIVLRIAAAAALQNRQYNEALAHIERNLRNGHHSEPIRLQYILALQSTGQTDRAVSEYRTILKDNPENRAMAYSYFAFCVSNNRKAELEALLPEIQNHPRPEQRYLAPFIEAELALLNRDVPAMTARLKKALADNPLDNANREDIELIYRVAYLFALVDEVQPAIELYLRIAEVYPLPILIQLNLAELYASIGNYDQALQLAQNAWQSNGSLLAVQECLGLRLVETKKYARAVQLLGLPVESKKASPRAMDAWRIAMEALIQQNLAAKKYLDSLNLCQQLLHHFAGNETAVNAANQCRAALGDNLP